MTEAEREAMRRAYRMWGEANPPEPEIPSYMLRQYRSMPRRLVAKELEKRAGDTGGA